MGTGTVSCPGSAYVVWTADSCHMCHVCCGCVALYGTPCPLCSVLHCVCRASRPRRALRFYVVQPPRRIRYSVQGSIHSPAFSAPRSTKFLLVVRGAAVIRHTSDVFFLIMRLWLLLGWAVADSPGHLISPSPALARCSSMYTSTRSAALTPTALLYNSNTSNAITPACNTLCDFVGWHICGVEAAMVHSLALRSLRASCTPLASTGLAWCMSVRLDMTGYSHVSQACDAGHRVRLLMLPIMCSYLRM